MLQGANLPGIQYGNLSGVAGKRQGTSVNAQSLHKRIASNRSPTNPSSDIRASAAASEMTTSSVELWLSLRVGWKSDIAVSRSDVYPQNTI